MAWEGWMEYGGTELINAARTETYVRAAGVSWFRGCVGTNYLPSVLGEEYVSPMQDDAPWTDPDDPDTYGFYGVYPLDIQGIDNGTATAQVTESTLDGGTVGRIRHTTKTMVFNVALMGRNECATEAGFRWLKRVLEGNVCSQSGSYCAGDNLCYLSCEPTCVYHQPCPIVWTERTHTFDPGAWLVQDGAVIEGNLFNPDFEGMLAASGYPPGTRGRARWTLTAGEDNSGSMLAWAGVVTPEGDDLYKPPFEAYTQILPGETKTVSYSTPAAGLDQAARPALWVEGSGTDAVYFTLVTGIGEEDCDLTPEGCVDCQLKYQRSLRDVGTTVGPTVTAKRTAVDGSAIWTVTFTLVAGDPFEYGMEQPVIEGFMDPNVAVPFFPGAVPEGGSFDDVGYIEDETVCPVPTYQPVVDPECTFVIPPPEPPSVRLSCFVDPDSPSAYLSRFTRRQFVLPPQYVPLWGDVVPKVEIHAVNGPIRNMRLRFYADPLESGDPDLDVCNYCGDVIVSYIPQGSTMVLDGSSHEVYVLNAGGVRQRAAHLLFSSNGEPFEWPELSCGLGYIVTVDLPMTQDLPVMDMSLYARAV